LLLKNDLEIAGCHVFGQDGMFSYSVGRSFAAGPTFAGMEVCWVNDGKAGRLWGGTQA
jgi:hypothetical protein